MSDFSDLISEGFEQVLAQTTGADGAQIQITFTGKSASVVPGTQAQQRQLRESGMWVAGMVVVELFRTEVDRLALADRSVVEYGPRRQKMKAMIFDDDPSDPAVRVTLQPDHAR